MGTEDRFMGAEPKQSGSLAARVEALAPRRLMALTGIFVLAMAGILFGKLQEEASARKVETNLRVAQGADGCANAANVSIMTGASVREALGTCKPGGAAAIFYLSQTGDIVSAVGAVDYVDLDPAVVRSLTLNVKTDRVLDLPTGKAAASWRPLDNGEALMVAAPANDIYQRTPLWINYSLILAAIALVTASLMAAFIRQSRIAAKAAGALEALRDTKAAMTAGRTSTWSFSNNDRSVKFSRSFLEPIGLGARDRRFSMHEISALVHPEDLRTALAILTGDTSGVTEGMVRFREPGGAWSRAYLRTSSDATRFNRTGMAFDLSDSGALSPSAAIAESRLKDAIESIPEAFILWDAHGRLAAWNRRFASIFRLDGKSLQPGMEAREIAAIARGGGEIIARYFAPEAAIDEMSVEVALKNDRWLHISRRRTAEGGLVCVASNITDVKRRARAQKKKERLLEGTVKDLQLSRQDLSETMQKYEIEKHRAEEASRSKSEFLANMSHELRTPLNAINGFSEIMQSELYGPLGDDKYKEYIGDILSSGRHLLELIEDVLDMSKIEAGRIQLEPSRVELERVLQESARLVAKRAKDAGITLTTSVNHAPAVWADARAVKQVTLNLLSNAVKFTPEGGEVTLTAEADLDGVTVIVADSGAGIEGEHLRKLGAPFEMVENQFSKSNRGSGLGLALSKSLMELQGGILAIASQPGKGTVACASFPRRKDAKVRLPQFIRTEAHILTSDAAPIAEQAAPAASEQAAE